MSKHKQERSDGLVYSTNSEYFNSLKEDTPSEETPIPEKQRLRVKTDTKQRAGKVVTLIEGFVGTEDDLTLLGKKIKTKCGSGGSVKEGLILIQGDYKDKIIGWLKEWGYGLFKK